MSSPSHAIFLVPWEHRGIGALQKCTDKNLHHYNWHRGAPWTYLHFPVSPLLKQRRESLPKFSHQNKDFIKYIFCRNWGVRNPAGFRVQGVVGYRQWKKGMVGHQELHNTRLAEAEAPSLYWQWLFSLDCWRLPPCTARISLPVLAVASSLYSQWLPPCTASGFLPLLSEVPSVSFQWLPPFTASGFLPLLPVAPSQY